MPFQKRVRNEIKVCKCVRYSTFKIFAKIKSKSKEKLYIFCSKRKEKFKYISERYATTRAETPDYHRQSKTDVRLAIFARQELLQSIIL